MGAEQGSGKGHPTEAGGTRQASPRQLRPTHDSSHSYSSVARGFGRDRKQCNLHQRPSHPHLVVNLAQPPGEASHDPEYALVGVVRLADEHVPHLTQGTRPHTAHTHSRGHEHVPHLTQGARPHTAHTYSRGHEHVPHLTQGTRPHTAHTHSWGHEHVPHLTQGPDPTRRTHTP